MGSERIGRPARRSFQYASCGALRSPALLIVLPHRVIGVLDRKLQAAWHRARRAPRHTLRRPPAAAGAPTAHRRECGARRAAARSGSRPSRNSVQRNGVAASRSNGRVACARTASPRRSSSSPDAGRSTISRVASGSASMTCTGPNAPLTKRVRSIECLAATAVIAAESAARSSSPSMRHRRAS